MFAQPGRPGTGFQGMQPAQGMQGMQGMHSPQGFQGMHSPQGFQSAQEQMARQGGGLLQQPLGQPLGQPAGQPAGQPVGQIVGALRLPMMKPTGERVNGGYFMQLPSGSAVRMMGKVETAGGRFTITPSDGGSIPIQSEPGDNLSPLVGSFVDVIGTRGSDGALRAVTMIPLHSDVDNGLWEEAVKMMHLPQLRQFFSAGDTAEVGVVG